MNVLKLNASMRKWSIRVFSGDIQSTVSNYVKIVHLPNTNKLKCIRQKNSLVNSKRLIANIFYLFLPFKYKILSLQALFIYL